MPDIPIIVDGDDSFVFGANSFVMPTKLGPGEYVMGMNIVNRGGLAQTRPGSQSLPFSIPMGNLQGLTLFRPLNGTPSLVFAVDGVVYYSPAPFSEMFTMANVRFSPYTRFIAWASCVQSTFYTPNGTLDILPVPKSVLIMQDGATRAAYWDGHNSGHLNPTASTSEFTSDNTDGTPVGLWMCWSNNRLWVSRGNIIFASDLGNPLKFADERFIAEGRRFYLPGSCTGIAETSDQQGIICFTPENGVFIKSSIQDRTTWLSTPDFQKTVLPNVGCVAPRSIIQQHGLLWWFTPKGLINQDDALRLNLTSRLNVQDQEMIQSKANVSYDISGCAGSFFENFLFHALPNGDKLNTRIHVMDQAPQDDGSLNSWPSYWEGWRPVEFARGVVNNQERVFCISYDYDNRARIWELFLPDRTDNGIPITSYLETKTNLFQNRDYKRFRYAELELAGVSGPTAIMVAVAGLRGAYQNMGVKDMAAEDGQVYFDVQYGDGENDFFGSRPQTRIIRTIDKSEPSDCNSLCIESEKRGLIDKGFSLLIVWSGIAAISAYRIFAQNEPIAYQGICEENETDEIRLLTVDGCGSNDLISSGESFTTYFATATFSRISPTTGLVVTNTSTQSSLISQVDADRKASRMAKWYVLSEIGEYV